MHSKELQSSNEIHHYFKLSPIKVYRLFITKKLMKKFDERMKLLTEF